MKMTLNHNAKTLKLLHLFVIPVYFCFATTMFFSACAVQEETLSIGQPAAFALLGDLDINGQVIAYKNDADQTESCSGRIAKQESMVRNGNSFHVSLDLSPGQYKLCIEFKLTDGNILISRYQDIPVTIKTGDDQVIGNDAEAYYFDRDDKTPSDFDFDGDGIFNLDELLFGLDIRQNDPVERPEDVELEAPASGTFYIGSDADDALVEERPGATRSVGHFWIDRFEVNQQAYARCVARNICPLPMDTDKLSFANSIDLTTRNHESDTGLDAVDDPGTWPITAVTQDAAASFCAMHDGRLPREEEWEYAAIPNQGPYPWSGDANMENLFATSSQCEEINARYPGNHSGEPAQACTDPQQDSHGEPISTLAFGYEQNHTLGCSSTPGNQGDHAGPCQMAGNVWEWTSSVFEPYSNNSGWTAQEGLVVARGGSADSLSLSLRSSYRFGAKPNLEDQQTLAPLIGFRCVYEAP